MLLALVSKGRKMTTHRTVYVAEEDWLKLKKLAREQRRTIKETFHSLLSTEDTRERPGKVG